MLFCIWWGKTEGKTNIYEEGGSLEREEFNDRLSWTVLLAGVGKIQEGHDLGNESQKADG